MSFKVGSTGPDNGIVIYIDDINGLEAQPADYDNGKALNWAEAKTAANSYGPDWRLPTASELNLLYRRKDIVGNFTNLHYWSSTNYDNYNAWYQYFSNGYQIAGGKTKTHGVRAVRGFLITAMEEKEKTPD